jgi:SpoIIAA-like
MSAEIVSVVDGVLTLRVRGTLTHAELTAVQRKGAEILAEQGTLRVLVLAEGFAGWARGGDWGDVSFQSENDARIAKLAIVGDRKWEELALMFTAQGLRDFPIEYFELADTAGARAWLAKTE